MNRHILALALLGALAAPAVAQTNVTNAWVRGTVAHQNATGAFMQIISEQGGRLVQASSPAAGVVEIHEMTMDNNVMKMRAITGLDLPAGKPVELKPGGCHVMLMDLKHELKDGEQVPITLVVEGRDGKRESLQVMALVKPLAAGAPAGHDH
ncbi:MAG: copper chaperone PCu(A)C [Burkholderiales bacterium]